MSRVFCYFPIDCLDIWTTYNAPFALEPLTCIFWTLNMHLLHLISCHASLTLRLLARVQVSFLQNATCRALRSLSFSMPLAAHSVLLHSACLLPRAQASFIQHASWRAFRSLSSRMLLAARSGLFHSIQHLMHVKIFPIQRITGHTHEFPGSDNLCYPGKFF